MMVWKLRKLRGKFNPTIKKKKYPNLQWAILVSGKKVKACTQCIKTLAKTKNKLENKRTPAAAVTPVQSSAISEETKTVKKIEAKTSTPAKTPKENKTKTKKEVSAEGKKEAAKKTKKEEK